MPTLMNRQIRLKSRPTGLPTLDNFQFVEVPLPPLEAGQVLVSSRFISVDPYMRGRMSERKSYVPPYALNEPIAGGVVAEVVETKSPNFAVGDIVLCGYGWQTHAVVHEDQIRKINPSLAPISTALGVLGMPGLTAYFGLLDIGRPAQGETVVVSGAAGAVGMIVGQIAKIKGARVVGIAGSDAKVNYLTQELGFDAVINYKTSPDLNRAVAKACPAGVDVYFDNVGGSISDAVLAHLNDGARIPICGQIALYNLEQADVGPRVQSQLLIHRALMKGFIVGDYSARFGEGISQLAKWVQDGQLKFKETIVHGFDNTVNAFLGLFSGENLGKQLVQV
ncbi:putative NADP-dependent oxidoreductase YfmJ [Alicyclobacillus contaminans]|uniref:NADP-dependent oxidoreductase n=1 Tax=Alicyclobacillus contaminans TaxID=392016 RepID=UPI000419647B|nr:NADP-dependent oxidoreductase [Alicyclobacillus contaminans]GMA51034.1 putative NADP-dependent oxidoreductase YfmJ [Alicyclobacillus contaminans]